MSRRKILEFLDQSYFIWQARRFGKDTKRYKKERKRVYAMSCFELVSLLDTVLGDMYRSKCISN